MLQLPESWSDWRIVSELGEGAYSTVYAAARVDDPGIRAAIKVVEIPHSRAELDELSVEGIDEADSNHYFEAAAEDLSREIRLMQQFKGMQNFVSIEDYKSVPKESGIGFRVFIRMELLTPLDRWALDRRLTEQDVLRIGADLCTALTFLEQKSLVHRDIKPANIFVNDTAGSTPFYKLGDFGIARSLMHRSQGLSSKGTPNYIAPEVAAAQPYDGRADIYSLGLTLYRLLNGNRLPFLPQQQLLTPAMRQEAVSRRLSGEPLPPPLNASERVAAIILKACAFRPEDRYATAREMHRDIQAAMRPAEDGTASAGSVKLPKPPRTEVIDGKKHGKRPAGKKRRTMILAAAAAMVIQGGIAAFVFTRPRGNAAPAQGSMQTAERDRKSAPTPTAAVRPTVTEPPVNGTGSYPAGSIVTFGSCVQSPQGEPEPIRWIVTESDDMKRECLLLSESAPEIRSFQDVSRFDGAVSWETCTLRSWCEEAFLNDVFTGDRSLLLPVSGIDGDARVTVPGVEQYARWRLLYGALRAAPTALAMERVKDDDEVTVTDGCVAWWLKEESPRDCMSVVDWDGEIREMFVGSAAGVRLLIRVPMSALD